VPSVVNRFFAFRSAFFCVNLRLILLFSASPRLRVEPFHSPQEDRRRLQLRRQPSRRHAIDRTLDQLLCRNADRHLNTPEISEQLRRPSDLHASPAHPFHCLFQHCAPRFPSPPRHVVLRCMAVADVLSFHCRRFTLFAISTIYLASPVIGEPRLGHLKHRLISPFRHASFRSPDDRITRSPDFYPLPSPYASTRKTKHLHDSSPGIYRGNGPKRPRISPNRPNFASIVQLSFSPQAFTKY
jgi:hypothetical protein